LTQQYAKRKTNNSLTLIYSLGIIVQTFLVWGQLQTDNMTGSGSHYNNSDDNPQLYKKL
jgi:hypothetical protein